ncbi:MAG: hypothetical protein D6B28_07935 [Gammaproteobacteria bacterium]|nr:MAG: hypothetical protein D6B28_07935 [Gammaproteobacteria bacterium]
MNYHRISNPKKQNGAVLLLLMFAVIIGFASLFIAAYNNNNLNIEKDKKTTEQLGIAKQAILDYVTANYHLYQIGDYGFLPCPDTAAGAGLDDGEQHSGCLSSHRNSIGHLPWRTLGLPPLLDSSGECLWYVATGLEKQIEPANTASGLIRLFSGDRFTEISDPADPFVAAIIAPQKPLEYQNRAGNSQNMICEQSFAAAEFLDRTQLSDSSQVNNAALSGSIDTADIFISAEKRSTATLPPYSAQNPQPFNDQIIYITRDELLAAINKAGVVTIPQPPPEEATLDESTAQITFTNDLENFDQKSGNGTYTATPNGSDSELQLHKTGGFFPIFQATCLWYNEPFELEDKTLRTFYKFKLQHDISANSLNRCSGFTFAITPGPSTSCGDRGGSLGFAGMSGNPENRTFAVEYDIASSFGRGDPSGNHIAVVTRSNNNHNSSLAATCPGAGCYYLGNATQEEVTWLEDQEEHSTRIEIHTGYTDSDCSSGGPGSGGSFAKVMAWMDCEGYDCTDFGKLDSDYNEATNAALITHCIDFPSQMEGDPDNGGNGIRFGFTAAFGGCNFSPTQTDVTLSEFGLTIE